MTPTTRLYWRGGWILVGLLGLIALTLWPPPPPPAPSNPTAAWVDALWRPSPGRVQALLETGMDPARPLDPLGSQALHVLFAGAGCDRRQRPTRPEVMETLDELLVAGAPVNGRDQRGNTPLLLAVSRCDCRVVERLLTAGAAPGDRNLVGLTPLEIAVTSDSDAVAALVGAGARLAAERIDHYRAVYADEPAVLQRLDEVERAEDRGCTPPHS